MCGENDLYLAKVMVNPLLLHQSFVRAYVERREKTFFCAGPTTSEKYVLEISTHIHWRLLMLIIFCQNKMPKSRYLTLEGVYKVFFKKKKK